MENEKLIREKILEIAKLNVYLWQNGGAAACPNEFEKLLHLQQDLLNKFGLPGYRKHLALFEFQKVPKKPTIDKVIKQLHQFALEYFSEEVKTREQFLHDTIGTFTRSEDALAEIGILPHIYTNFVFYKILQKQKASAKEVLRIYDYVTDLELLNDIGLMGLQTKTSKEFKAAAVNIEKHDIPYIKQYVNYTRRRYNYKVVNATKHDENSHEVPF